MQRFKPAGSAQRFASAHSTVYTAFDVQRHLIPRRTLRAFRAGAHGGSLMHIRMLGAFARQHPISLTKTCRGLPGVSPAT